MTVDYNNMIERAIMPKIHNTVFIANIEPYLKLFPSKETIPAGDRITVRKRTAWNSNAGQFVKGDVSPASATQVTRKPWWEKVFYQGAVEVEGIDMSNARTSGDLAVNALIEDSFQMEAKSVMAAVLAGCMAQMRNDVSNAAIDYSDAALTRALNPTLASYEEANAAAISVAFMRGCYQLSTINKDCGPLSGYVFLMAPATYNTFMPLANALHMNVVQVQSGAAELGFPQAAKFEGVDIVVPDGMTAGDVLFLRKEDVNFLNHMVFEYEPEPTNEFTYRWVLRVGMNANVLNPGFQGKMTNKT